MQKNLLVVINLKFNLNRRALFIELFKKDYNIYVCCPHDDSEPDIEGIRYIYSSFLDNSATNIFNDIRFAKELFTIKNKIKPDIVMSFTIKPNIYCGLVFFNKNITCIKTFTGLGYSFIKNDLKSKIARILLDVSIKSTDNLVVQNESDYRLLKNRYKKVKTYKVNGSGIDLRNFSIPKIKSHFHRNILFIGRLINEKGVNIITKNLNELDSFLSSININLFIIGEYHPNNPDSILESDYLKIKTAKSIKYIDGPINLNEYYSKSDLILNFSKREGLSRVIIEAMYFGNGVVTNNNPGCYEMLISNKINSKINSYDLSELKKKINEFYNLNSNTMYIARKDNNNHILTNFTSENIYNSYFKLMLNDKNSGK